MDDKLRQEILRELPNFTGSEQMWIHQTPFGKLHLTDGCNYIRQKCQAYWLFDLIQSYQPSLKQAEFQVWKLERVNDMDFLVSCEDGNDNVLLQQKIHFSDFPLQALTVWNIEGVVLLPSEY